MRSAVDAPRLLARADVIRWQKRSRIPHDQQAILDGPTSWAVDLDGKPFSAAQIPGHVLQTVKEAYARRTAGARISTQPPAPPPSSRPRASAPASTPARARSQGLAAESDQNHNPPSSSLREAEPASSVISWEATPPRSEPRRAPPRPPSAASHKNGASVAGEEVDDTVDEMELELELPQPIQHRGNVPAVDLRSARRLGPAQNQTQATGATSPLAPTAPETPPCGQGEQSTIRETVQKKTSNVGGRSSPAKAQRPTRRMKPVEFPEDRVDKDVDTDMQVSAVTMPSPRISAVEEAPPGNGTWEEVDMVSASASASSSVVPATDREPATSVQYAAADPPPPDLSAHMAPYEFFTTVYPDYTTRHAGNLRKFVQACVALQVLQRNKAVREFWYDDFIQAFCGFIRYAQNAGPGHEPVPAIEWYCGIRGPMLYDKMVVLRENLDQILAFYPAEVAEAKATIKTDREEPHPARVLYRPRTLQQQHHHHHHHSQPQQRHQWRQPSIVAPKLASPQFQAHDSSRQSQPSPEPQPQPRLVSPELGSDPMEADPSPKQASVEIIESTPQDPPPTASAAGPIQPEEPSPEHLAPPPPPPPAKPAQAFLPPQTPQPDAVSSSAPVQTSSLKRAPRPDEPSSSARSLKRRKIRSSTEKQQLFERFRTLPGSSATKA